MPKDEKKPFEKWTPKTVRFVQPFEGEFSPGGLKSYKFKVTYRDLYPKGRTGNKVPVEKLIDSEVVYEWLKKFEAVSA